MKPPVKLDTLMEEWSKDCKLDSTEPGLELIRISTLHGKYLNILSHHRMLSRKYESEYNKMKLIKFQYYSGDLNNPEDLEQYGWEPMQRIVKQNIQTYLDADSDLNNLLLKKIVHQEIVEFTTSVIKELNNRVFSLRSFIDWEKFTAGR